MVKSWLLLVLVAFAKGLALLALLYGYVNLHVRGLYDDPTRALAGYLQWRVGLLLVGYYVAYALITKGRTTRKRFALLFLWYVLMLTILSPIYAFVLLINYFPMMVILHLFLLVILVECAFNVRLIRNSLVDHRLA
ncbi:hypothetical protein [Hymenobacter terrestris]|uniref:Uncharacterized protein n=1 Tax=Hymenobacter terrestris TaxID=2748310 RepID=A0ABX2Q589_9BACT|nr:hypothetical protein [Hymenobacter terrestris]NVO86137.1 hypothetical protein [Hymenobacter terrestris]